MRDRFASAADVVDALLGQRIVQGNRDAAAELAAVGDLVEFLPGQLLMEQGTTEQDLFFLLAGRVQIVINGIRLYPREAGVAVGQMSAIDPRLPRAATVKADTPVVALRVSGRRFAEIAHRHSRLWELLAQELATRIAHRNLFIKRANPQPRVFLICSQEAQETAEAVRSGLSAQAANVVLWSDDQIFPPGSYPLENLEREVHLADFGIAFAQPDDLLRSRHRQRAAPRDNVIFELGFFLSRLGRQRTLLLVPRKEKIKLPSDFKGVLPIYYELSGDPQRRAVELEPVVHEISRAIAAHGVRLSSFESG
ncbi:TIR domain-containing protein [Tahibacter caeni]|uniref:TIR domain-containing protein n=1 Tax=Tahibacter caeni TaxID=1453545 RepID=UPI002148A781|nr:TIR domain-containing protein [Tahibacter caeni]